MDAVENVVEKIERETEKVVAKTEQCLLQCGEEKCMCREILPWLGFLALCYLASWIGSLFINVGDGSWYQHLNRPIWTPPAWIFPIVWTTLYFLLGTAVWWAWKTAGCRKICCVLGLFLLLLACMAAWPYCFFGRQSPFTGFLDLIWAFAFLVLLMLSIAPIQKWAAVLLIPQMLWMAYALVLNFTIWRMQ
ncbi:MAG: TspO/MBR family protein [Planctomycetia bacterium]|nr:TspO/MBR family protein [Planctomycetia bacterium]